jgi:DNA-binding NarL/FixJ family response regulator
MNHDPSTMIHHAMIRVLLADDHALLRAGLRTLLAGRGGIVVVAEAGDGREALRLVREQRPDVALVDVAMPGLSGLELAERIADEQPATRVLILSMHKDEAYVRRALHAGVAGYLLKDSDTDELERAIRAVARGDGYFSPAVSALLAGEYRRGGEPPAEALSPRQREVLRQIALGRSTKAIARALGLSVKTVETHRAGLMRRLHIHDVAGLVRYALREKLVPPD